MSRIEIERTGPSFTVDTLRELLRRLPGDELHLVMGADQLEAFPSWKEPEEVARLARLVVIPREGREPHRTRGVPTEYRTLPVTRVDLSSTEIRRRIREGRSLRYRVPEAVLQIIETEGLYKLGDPSRKAGAGAADR